ncbi:DUF4166 domain-containing protein [Lysobacter fragariae]
MENATTRWFGPYLTRLHPRLQALHREGGCLRGTVTITSGKGLAGSIGRWIARRMGMPLDRPLRGFEVRIRHDRDAMTWERRFEDGTVLASTFRPVGHFPDGYWLEEVGPMQLKLAVDVIDGGWHWRLLGASIRGAALPRFLFPRTTAFKRIDRDGRYCFGVSFALFPFGTLLQYEGLLQPE